MLSHSVFFASKVIAFFHPRFSKHLAFFLPSFTLLLLPFLYLYSVSPPNSAFLCHSTSFIFSPFNFTLKHSRVIFPFDFLIFIFIYILLQGLLYSSKKQLQYSFGFQINASNFLPILFPLYPSILYSLFSFHSALDHSIYKFIKCPRWYHITLSQSPFHFEDSRAFFSTLKHALQPSYPLSFTHTKHFLIHLMKLRTIIPLSQSIFPSSILLRASATQSFWIILFIYFLSSSINKLLQLIYFLSRNCSTFKRLLKYYLHRYKISLLPQSH